MIAIGHIRGTGTDSTITEFNEVLPGDTSIVYIDDYEYEMEYESFSDLIVDYEWKFDPKFYKDENSLNVLLSICKGYRSPSVRNTHQKPHRVLRMMVCNRM